MTTGIYNPSPPPIPPPLPPPLPSVFYGLAIIQAAVAPAPEYPGVDPVLRPIQLGMAVGSDALTVFCVATCTVICFATEKTSEIKL